MLVHPTMSVKTGTLANALAYHLNRSRIEDGGLRIEDGGSRVASATESSRERIDPVSSILDPQSSSVDSRPVIRPGIVHRLDRATSGLIVIAKTPRALTVLSNHFRRRLVEKRYLALVHGVVGEDAGSIAAPIGRDADERPHWRVTQSGRAAETRFTVLERFQRGTLLELEPVTGRTNQLRIHCAHIGHPIVGDDIHCGLQIADCELGSESSDSVRQSEIRNPKSAMRLCLHAWKLAFHHPANGEWVEFASPVPDDFSAIIDRHRREDF